jgi:membrane protease YdiL (CAAX protease family)
VNARSEWIGAAALFAFAVAAFAAREWRTGAAALVPALLMFALLTGTILSLSVARWREWLRGHVTPWGLRLFLAPAAITAAIAAYSAATGLPIVPRVVAYAVYLAAPAVILGLPRGASTSWLRVLVAAVVLWLPIECDRLPPLPLPAPGGFRGAPFAALADVIYLCLIACPVDGIGYTFALRRRDFGAALLATAIYAIAGIPLGLATGFLTWGPRIDPATALVVPIAIYLVTAVPEEFLFRGLIQNALTRAIGRAGLPTAAVIFGFAHLPDPRYVVLAALAGVAYGWVYQRTGRITASAVTHAFVDWIWVMLLRG